MHGLRYKTCILDRRRMALGLEVVGYLTHESPGAMWLPGRPDGGLAVTEASEEPVPPSSLDAL